MRKKCHIPSRCWNFYSTDKSIFSVLSPLRVCGKLINSARPPSDCLEPQTGQHLRNTSPIRSFGIRTLRQVLQLIDEMYHMGTTVRRDLHRGVTQVIAGTGASEPFNGSCLSCLMEYTCAFYRTLVMFILWRRREIQGRRANVVPSKTRSEWHLSSVRLHKSVGGHSLRIVRYVQSVHLIFQWLWQMVYIILYQTYWI